MNSCQGLGTSEVRDGTKIRTYTKAECDQLGGEYAGNGECLKQGGGSFSWDCREEPDLPKRASNGLISSAAMTLAGVRMSSDNSWMWIAGGVATVYAVYRLTRQ